MIKLIVFDIDDTLYNELDYVKSGYKVVSEFLIKKYNIKDCYKKLIDLFCISSKNVFNRLLDEEKIIYDSDDIFELVNIYRNHFPNIKISDDKIEVIKELKNNYKLAIVSDGNYSTQKLKSDALGLESFFDKIILTDKFGKEYWKPSNKAFELLSKKFNVSFEEMIYIGDNPNKDFYYSFYGIRTIRFVNYLGIYFKDNYYDNIKENYKIENFFELFEILKEINKYN